MKQIAGFEIGQRRALQYAAGVRLHRNVPGWAGLQGDSYPLEMPLGI
jgi:hypothetical protein